MTGATEPTIARSCPRSPRRRRAPGPIDVLVVASWFPAYDDPAEGRFVADQVDGRSRPGDRPAVRRLVRSGSGCPAGRRHAGIRARSCCRRRSRRRPRPSPCSSIASRGSSRRVGRGSADDRRGPDQAAERAHGAIHRERLLVAAAERLVDPAGRSPVPLRRSVVHAHTGYPGRRGGGRPRRPAGAPLFITEHARSSQRHRHRPAVRERYAAASPARSGCSPSARCSRTSSAASSRSTPTGSRSCRTPSRSTASRWRPPPTADPTSCSSSATARRRRASRRCSGRRRSPRAAARSGSGSSAATPTPTRSGAGTSWSRRSGSPTPSRSRSRATGAGIAAAMAGASLFVHPSPRETFGVVAVEALATGMPVVATDSGGVTEILGPEPERLGALVPGRPDSARRGDPRHPRPPG